MTNKNLCVRGLFTTLPLDPIFINLGLGVKLRKYGIHIINVT